MRYRGKSKSLIMRRFKSKAGSALIWALAIALILSIVLIAGLGMVQRQQNTNVQQHIENQAYFSASSVTQAVIGWLSGTNYDTLGGVTAGQEAQFEFINWITDPANRNEEKPLVTNALLDPARPELGTYTIYVKSSEDGSEITFRTVATHADATETVIGTMSKTSTADILYGEKDPWDPIQVPDPPATINNNTLVFHHEDGPDTTLDINGIPEYPNNPSPTGTYKIQGTNGGATVSRVCDTLIAYGNGGTVRIGVNTINLLVIKGNTLVFPVNGFNLSVKTLVIESGGVLSIRNGTDLGGVENIYVMPGGRLINATDANWTIEANITIYASLLPPPAPNSSQMIAYQTVTSSGNNVTASWPTPPPGTEFPAYVNLLGASNARLGNIIVQPANPDLAGTSQQSYWPILAGLDGMTMAQSALVHIPFGYGTIPSSVRSRACSETQANFLAYLGNPSLSASELARAESVRRDAPPPYCPHFEALVGEDIEFEDIIWGGSYSRG